ncbi:MAG: phosphotransferase family protein [Dehalococcoidia bacterium]
MAQDDLRPGIEAFLQRAAGARSVRVDDLRRLTGGASRETWSLDAVVERDDGAETLPLILQRDTRGAPKPVPRALEFALLGAACAAGVPAPEPLFLGDASIGGEFFIVRRVEGETLPRRLFRDDVYAAARASMTPQLGAILARIHTVPVDQPALAALPGPPPATAPAVHEVERYEPIFRAIAPEPHPAFELAFRWLRQAAPFRAPRDAEPRILVHGDYRMGNVLFGPDGVRAILDWELAHAGDPMEDLGWMCVRSWRFGGQMPVGGIGERDEFFAAYEAAGGAKVDPDRVRFWEVFGNLRWGIICLSQTRTYLDRRSDSVELASIGRRTAETEWELLDLID